TAAFQVNEVCCHHDKFAGNLDVQLFERLKILKVLAGDAFERDIVNVDLILFDKIKKQIERAFENLELDLVIGFHVSRPILDDRTSKEIVWTKQAVVAHQAAHQHQNALVRRELFGESKHCSPARDQT